MTVTSRIIEQTIPRGGVDVFAGTPRRVDVAATQRDEFGAYPHLHSKENVAVCVALRKTNGKPRKARVCLQVIDERPQGAVAAGQGRVDAFVCKQNGAA